MPAVKHKKAELVFPSDTKMTNEEFVKVVKEAEKGPFYTSDEVNQFIKKWSKKYSL